MAFGSVGTLGTNQNKVSGTTLAITTSAAAEVGNIIVVVTAWDNTDTADGITTRLTCADSAGNTYTKIREYTESVGAAEDGATCAVFYTVVTTQLAAAGTITVTSSTARVAKASTAWEFTKGAGTTLALEGTPVVSSNQDVVSPDVTISSLPSREYLFLFGYAHEGASTITHDPDYTAWATNGTTGGGAATNMRVFASHRIATLTTDTVASATGTTVGAHVQILAALYEVAGGPAEVFGAATLTGSGALAGAGTQTASGGATLAGSGALTAAGTRTVLGSATLTGSGALEASGTRSVLGAAALGGSGALAAAGSRVCLGSAALAGSGALTASGVATVASAAALAGAGTLTASGTRSAFGAGALTGSGSLTAAGTVSTGPVEVFGAAVLAGSGALGAAGSVEGIVTGSAVLAGAGSLTAAGTRIVYGAAVLEGDGTLAAAGARVIYGAAVLEGNGALIAAGIATTPGPVTLVCLEATDAPLVVLASSSAELVTFATTDAGVVLVLAAEAPAVVVAASARGLVRLEGLAASCDHTPAALV